MGERSKREILAESPLFRNLLPPELDLLIDLVTEREYRAGDVVFSEGEPGDSLFLVADGAVEVLTKDPAGTSVTLAVVESPYFFGEMSLIDKEHRSATVRARADTCLLQLTNDNLHVFAKNFRNGFTWVVVNIARVLSARLREANRRFITKR